MESLDALLQLGNYGALGIFAWYTMTNNREWRAYLTERNSKLEKALDRLGAVLEKHVKE